MVIKARRSVPFSLSYLFLLFVSLLPAAAQDSPWEGPVRIPEFSFDILDFYAVGWSAQGRLAYGVSTPGEAGGRTWQWFVQDLVEDKILYASPSWTLMSGQTPAELWSRHPEWHSQLIRFGISPESTIQRGETTFRLGEVSFSLDVVMDRSETEDFPEGFTHNLAVRFYRNHNTAKLIYQYSPDPEQEVVDDLILKGYIKNPLENRIAVIALEKSGPDSSRAEWQYRVFGAHLSVGFSRVVRKGSDLAEAVLNGQLYVSRMLLRNGADPEEKDLRGYPALLLAARRRLWDIAVLLLEAGAGPGAADDKGRTPLHYAVAAGEAEVVALLLEAGADPDRKDASGLSARQEGAILGNPEVLRKF